MTRLLQLGGVLLALTAAACSSRGAVAAHHQVVLVPVAEEFTRGDLVRVMMTNETSRAVFRKQCETTLQRRLEDNSWSFAGGSVCGTETPAWQRIEPGATTRVDVPTLSRLEPGEYRVVIPIQFERDAPGSELSLNSSSFRLR